LVEEWESEVGNRWEEWKLSRIQSWLEEAQNYDQNAPLIFNACNNMVRKIYESGRIKKFQLNQCNAYLTSMLKNEKDIRNAFIEKRQKIEYARDDCVNKLPAMKKQFLYDSEPFNQCMDEKNAEIFKELWQDRAFDYFTKVIAPKRKPSGYWKKQGHMEAELTNLFKKYGFILTKKELKEVRKDLFRQLQKSKDYNYSDMIKKILPKLETMLEHPTISLESKNEADFELSSSYNKKILKKKYD